MKIQNIEGFEVIDSRGNPTVAARVNLEGSISALAMVPLELRLVSMKQMRNVIKILTDI